ncbi:FAD-binding oxidoreductase [Streptomyces sp. CMB-StM0423]|uniref:FAD-binding oxidoreductase n=1 Tax=Streptomyces sp. CMB-StM0423 TaxID=2059884 RepID=UPI001F3D957C|nr:FAD-binding oxidoreductase [Streptomyces sp. CMB-StM0423]
MEFMQFRPGESGYETELSGFNRIVSHRPAAVAAVRSVAEVRAAVRYAAERGMPVAVQSTGHGPAGAVGADTLLLSVRRLRGVRVDPAARTARVAAGTRWQEVVDAAAPHGLAPLCGSSPLVGVVGYTLGGGLGPLARTYGYAADQVTAVELVTADGRLREVTAEREPELFWALRGGGKGGFGVVTALTFRLPRVARLYGGGLRFAGADAAAVLGAWRRVTAAAPEELTTSVALLRVPGAGLTVHVRVAVAGASPSESESESGPESLKSLGEGLVRPLRAAALPVADTVRMRPYRTVAEIHEDPVDPMPYHERGILLREFDAAAEAALLAAAGPEAECADWAVELRHLGGAAGRPPAVPSAVGSRAGAFTLTTLTAPGTDSAVRAALGEWSTGGRYVNFLAGPGTEELAAEAYDAETYARLRAVKRTYDPENVFRHGHALPPAGSGAAAAGRRDANTTAGPADHAGPGDTGPEPGTRPVAGGPGGGATTGAASSGGPRLPASDGPPGSAGAAPPGSGGSAGSDATGLAGSAGSRTPATRRRVS